MLYFGIDWSEDHHDLSIRNEAGRISRIRFAHDLKGFERIEQERRKLGVAANECLVAIETAHNLLVDFLLDNGYVIYIIPPQATAAYRNRGRSSGAHTDDSDADLLARILITDRQSHRRLEPNLALTQQMLAQVRLIEVLRRSIQRQAAQLRACLLRVFPQAVDLFGSLTAQITLEFLLAYPTAQEAQRLSAQAFKDFCRSQHYSRPALVPQRYAHLLQPAPSADPAIVEAYRSHVLILADLLLRQVRQRTAAITQLQHLFQQHPDRAIFASLPGTGELLAPALLAKFGDHRQRFPAPAAVQALAGTCPVTQQSGKRRQIKFRRGCDKEFRRITQQFAQASISRSGWASAYYHDVRSHSASDSHAYRCLANRWLAIIWKLWQERIPYDEELHLRQRNQRHQPIS